MDNLNGVETPRINDEPTTYRNSKVWNNLTKLTNTASMPNKSKTKLAKK
jgi:hypothetical protein